MTERPILFSGPMVSALLGGRKTQTRRVVRKQFGPDAVPAEVPASSPEGWQVPGHSGRWWDDVGGCDANAVNCPFGVPGDHLWVREMWNTSALCMPPIDAPFIYAADLNSDGRMFWAARWKPSIHMPRAASRITLEVTGVRVERLQDISEDDAFAEGCPSDATWPIDWYRGLWDSINAARGFGWHTNPWVWVVEFRRLKCNI